MSRLPIYVILVILSLTLALCFACSSPATAENGETDGSNQTSDISADGEDEPEDDLGDETKNETSWLDLYYERLEEMGVVIVGYPAMTELQGSSGRTVEAAIPMTGLTAVDQSIKKLGADILDHTDDLLGPDAGNLSMRCEVYDLFPALYGTAFFLEGTDASGARETAVATRLIDKKSGMLITNEMLFDYESQKKESGASAQAFHYAASPGDAPYSPGEAGNDGYLPFPEGMMIYFSDGESWGEKSPSRGWHEIPYSGLKDFSAYFYAIMDGRTPEPPQKRIALTFDDGPDSVNTVAILDYLKEKHVRATFYICGNRVEKNVSVVRRMADEGHEIGNHSWNHQNFTKITADELEYQIQATQDAVFNAAGVYPRSVRPPYGAYSDKVLASVELPFLFWSIDTRDWSLKDAAAISDYIIESVKDGDVVLLHSIHDFTAEATKLFIDRLIDKGFAFNTVHGLFSENELEPGKLYRSDKR